MEDFLSTYAPYLPYMILGLLAVAGTMIVGILFFMSSRVKSSALREALHGSDLEAGEEGRKVAEKLGIHSSLYHFFQKLLTSVGVKASSEELETSFTKAVELLERHIGSRDFRYRIPWYLALGASDSGKSTLLENSELDLPIGRPEFETDSAQPPCKWWFFDRGIVLDILGDYFIHKDRLASDESGWSSLMNLLAYHRPKRPLDGVILTIPCDELMGEAGLTHDEIMARAKRIHKKLWHIQHSLAMKVPVYVMITKTDLIPGFHEFTKELPQENHRQMMGWSCPYTLETGYAPSWIDEAFDHMGKTLHHLRCEVFTEGKIKDRRDGAFAFNVEFSKIRGRLETYLNNIFRESTYHESFFLRGIYFTGDTGHHTEVSEHRRHALYSVPPEDLGSTIADPFEAYDERRISFLHDVFEEKIFREYTLARPVNRILVSTSKSLNFAKGVAALLLVTGAIGLYNAHERLSGAKKTLEPAIFEIDQTILRLNEQADSKGQDPEYLNAQTVKLLNLMSEINVTASKTPFIPASWFSDYDSNVRSALTAAWDRVILKSFFGALSKKARDLFFLTHHEEESGKKRDLLKPLQAPEFLALQDYVEDTLLLERQIKRYNNLEITQDIEDVGRLIKYLFKIDMPGNFYENAGYYTSALKSTKDRDLNIQDYMVQARQKLRTLYKDFQRATFNPEANLGRLTELIQDLEEFSQLSAIKDIERRDLRETVSQIFQVGALISSKEFNWIGSDVFNPGAEFVDVMNNMAGSRILGISITNELRAGVEKAFENYKRALKQLEAPFIGPILATHRGKVLSRPSKNFAQVLAVLRLFLKEPFMGSVDGTLNIRPTPPGRFVLWDEVSLQNAASLIGSYDTFLNEKYDRVPPELHRILKIIGRNHLRQHLLHLIAKSQHFEYEPRTLTGFDEQEALSTQVQNIKTVHPLFLKILSGHFSGDYSDEAGILRDILLTEGNKLLAKIDRLLLRDDLYNVGADTFSWWDGHHMLGLRAFGAYDLDDMKNYLLAQYTRVRGLAIDMADPVLSFLSLPYLNGLPRNFPLVVKWKKMIRQVDAYEKKVPSNSISILEHFLLNDLNTISAENCPELEEDPNPRTTDFFLQRRNDIHRKLVKRCGKITHTKAFEQYDQLSRFFNQNLAGKFPFSTPPSVDPHKEALPEDVNTFLALFEKLDAAERRAIEDKAVASRDHAAAATFLNNMDKIRLLLKSAVNGEMTQGLPKIKVIAKFRTNRDLEEQGDHIIDWSMTIDHQELNHRDSTPQGVWESGNQVNVMLRWASGGPRLPMPDPLQPSLSVRKHTASFKYTGRWSLIHLIKNHAVDTTRFGARGKAPMTLQFLVPTLPNTPYVPDAPDPSHAARLFITLDLVAPDQGREVGAPFAEGRSKIAPENLLGYPKFPTTAPPISRAHGKKRYEL